MLADVEKRAGANFSGYLQRLVATDLRNEPVDAMAENIMEELTRRLLGDRHLARIKPLIVDLDQRDELARILDSYISDRGEHSRAQIRRTRTTGIR